MLEKRLAVTLNNGRSHILDVPGNVGVQAVAAALVGETNGSDLIWDGADREWLRVDQGLGWVRRSAIVEVTIIDFADEPDVIYGEG
jgi:hypothetical protein